jgi:hypothetical protein
VLAREKAAFLVILSFAALVFTYVSVNFLLPQTPRMAV